MGDGRTRIENGGTSPRAECPAAPSVGRRQMLWVALAFLTMHLALLLGTFDLVDMEELGVWEPFQVKVQTIKTAIESAAMILRIDDIVSGISSKQR